MRRCYFACFAAVCLLVLAGPRVVAAQGQSGAIAGVVRDTSGAVLPGVTVEASSPALIEKVRTVVTDSQGRYSIVELRPGTYAVTFSLPSFATFRREGVELTTGFTATVNAELKVGALEETVTVSGASPVVDVQNVRAQRVLTREVLDSLPTGKAVQGYAALTLGAVSSQQDVGGNTGDGSTQISIHGIRDNDGKRQIDGMDVNVLLGDGGGRLISTNFNQVTYQEVVLETGGTAERETGGIQLNHVPRDGGNAFSIYAVSAYVNHNFQQSNFDDSLRARGLTTLPNVKRIFDYGLGVGGPIKKDRVWFYSSNRYWGAQSYIPSLFYNQTPGTLFYTADPSRPAYTGNDTKDFGGRLTWQVTTKQKITGANNAQSSCLCFGNALASPEAFTINRFHWNQYPQVTWNYTSSNRLLIQAGTGINYNSAHVDYENGAGPSSISINEQTTGFQYAALLGPGIGNVAYGHGTNWSVSNQVTVSYVTGSHAFKTGFGVMRGQRNEFQFINNDIDYTFRSGLPVSLRQWGTPLTWGDELRTIKLFAQDQWTIRRLTVNYGIRYDGLTGIALEEHVPATRFLPARDSARIDNVPHWNDISPRLGVAYNVFGNGKTAIKASVGRYANSMGIGIAQANNPLFAMVLNTTRTWNDLTFPVGDPRRGNFAPDCDLNSRVANGECGGMTDNAFGSTRITTRYAQDVLEGWGQRDYNWQASAGVQHELRPGLGVNATYFYTSYANFTATDNVLVAPTDFSPYCVTTPVDPRLPDGGGARLCGLYDVNPGRFGQVSNLVTQASNFGERKSVFNGVDIGFNSRFGRGGLLQGGVSVGRTETDTCFVIDSPQALHFCHVSPPWSAATQVKLGGVYPLPWKLQASATFQNLPGAARSANLPVINAQIAPSLGRNLAACPAAGVCTAAAVVPILAPQTQFEKRLTQLDVRLTKNLSIGRYRLRGMFDVYNIFNANTILGVNATYGPAWLRPTTVLGGRLFKIGGQLDL